MNDISLRRERIDAMERIERQLDNLHGQKQMLLRNLSEAQQDMFLAARARNTSADRYRKMQDALAATTQNANEINQLERQLARARETFERDYPRFGRGG